MNVVLIDRNARTAIVIAEGHKFTHLVQMEKGALVVRRFSPDDLMQRGFHEMPGYPVKRAVRKYLHHAGGVSEKAKAALKAIIQRTTT